MKVLPLAFLAVCIGLGACSPPAFVPEDVGATSADGYEGRVAHDVARAQNALSIPNDYREIVLPAPTIKGDVLFSIVPWRSYVYREQHIGLGTYQGANMTDLMAFQAAYRSSATDYFNVCAPTSLMVGGASWMGALSRGTSFGLFQNNCKWALLVRPNTHVGEGHVL